jgi:ankyrin repeat protein
MLCARKELNPNSLDRRGLTPLGIAAELGKPEIVEILLNAKSIQVDAGSVTPLWTAAKEGNPNIICQLIRAGADLSFCSKGKSVLAMAMRARNPRLLDFLLR